MEKVYDVLTSGYVSMDHMLKIQTPARVGYTSIITNRTNTKINYGGCGVNIACDLSRLGMKAMPMIRVGDDYEQIGFAAFLKESLPVNPMKCEYYLPTVVTGALERGEADVHVLTSADKWHGITYREDKPELVAALKKMSEDGLYPVDKLF